MESPTEFFLAPPSQIFNTMTPSRTKTSSTAAPPLSTSVISAGNAVTPRRPRSPAIGASSATNADQSPAVTALFSPKSFMSPLPTKKHMTSAPSVNRGRNNKRMRRVDFSSYRNECGEVHPHLLIPTFDDFVLNASPEEARSSRMRKLPPLKLEPRFSNKSNTTLRDKKTMRSSAVVASSGVMKGAPPLQEKSHQDPPRESSTPTCFLKIEPSKTSRLVRPVERSRTCMSRRLSGNALAA